MPKQSKKQGKRKYEKPISLYPIPFEQAVRALLSVPRPKKQQKKKSR